jgi:integrase/recombinase XerD
MAKVELPSQREMSVQTADTYAYAFQLLVCFAAERLKTTPSALSIEQLNQPTAESDTSGYKYCF